MDTNFNDTIKKFQRYSEDLSPSKQQEQRVRNAIFSNNFENSKKESTLSKFLNLFSMKNKHKALWGVAGLFGLCIFVSLPLIFMGKMQMTKQNALPPSPPERIHSESQNEVMEDEMTQEYKNKETLNEPDSSDFIEMEEQESVSGYYGTETDIMPDFDYERDGTDVPEDTKTPMYERAQKREAYIDITVDDFNNRYTEFTGKISSIGGYIQTSETNSYEDYSYGNFTIRVPVAKFDEMMDFLRNLGVSINSENITITDKQNELTHVSKKIEDNEAQIKTLKDKDYLTNEEKEKLARLERELESDKKEQKEILEETEFSTISVYMRTEDIKEDEWSISNTFSEVLRTLEYIVQFWINVALWSLVPLAFFLPVVIGIVLLIKLLKKKRRNTKKS
ncbi:DUF4349 domain-containing protein [Candidatus Dojkabacteria bacterium]|nr:DUF4349 domain-containing protein [Candidatus Dojkabacteria bacterium]